MGVRSVVQLVAVLLLLALLAAGVLAMLASRPERLDAGPESVVSKAMPTDVQVTVVGEIHGTTEAPEEFLKLVSRALQDAAPILVGVEIPPGSLEDLRNAWKASHDEQAVVSRIRSSAFWFSAKDGRTSKANLRTILKLLELEDKGSVFVVGFDTRSAKTTEPFGPAAADYVLARLEEINKSHRANIRNVYLLTGRSHANYQAGDNSISASLAERGHATISTIYEVNGGTAWVCMMTTCAVHKILSSERCTDGKTVPVGNDERRKKRNQCIGNVTASPPIY